MNQILQEEQRKYLSGVGKIGKTHEILNQLQLKMAGYHERKRTQEQLLESREEAPQQTKTKNTFKLFHKPQSQTNPQKMDLHELELEVSKEKSQGQVGHLLQEVEAIEQLVRKKLALKEERVGQLEREVQLAGQEKLHLYKLNCQLQEQLNSLQRQAAQTVKKQKTLQDQMQAQLKTLKQIYQNKKVENKTLKKEEELLRETLKQSQARRKNYHESEIKVLRQKSKSRMVNVQSGAVEQQKYLRELVGELDKLRKMVKSKMKKSASRAKVR